MTTGSSYADALGALYGQIVQEEAASIQAGATALADRVAAGGLIHVLAPGGHSQLAALDVFYRPGCPAAIAPLWDAGSQLTSGALRSTRQERTEERGARLIDDAGLGAGEVLVVVNAFGVNATVIDAARRARARGVLVIGLSSLACERSLEDLDTQPARQAAGRTLSALADVHIDTKVPPGDTAPLPDGVRAPMATSANAFAMQSLMLETVARLRARGAAPDVWASSNSAGGDEHNSRLAALYGPRIGAL